MMLSFGLRTVAVGYNLFSVRALLDLHTSQTVELHCADDRVFLWYCHTELSAPDR